MKMSMYKIIRIVLGSLLCFSCVAFVYRSGQAYSGTSITDREPKLTIVFDLGGVMFEANRTHMFWNLGPKALFYYWKNKPPHAQSIKDSFYTALNNITNFRKNPYNSLDMDGHSLPYLLSEWLTGTKSSRELRLLIYQNVQEHPEWFTTKAEQQLVLRITKTVFIPEIFAHTQRPINEMIEFAKECKTKGYNLFVLSNWDPESFAILQEKYSDIFDLFDGVIISGYVHDLKPAPSMFQNITAIANPETSVFIDDQKENIHAAKQCGMHAIRCKKKNGWITSSIDVEAIRRKIARIENKMAQMPLASFILKAHQN